MNINTKALKGVIEEIEASRARQKGEAEFQREAIKRAVKQHQLDGKAIRIVLQRRAMGDEKRDEQDYYVHAYEHALGEKKHAADALAAGAGVRETARATGLSVGTVSALKKAVQKSPELNTAPKPEDGDDGITGGEDERSDQVPVIAEDRQGSGEGGRRGVAGGAVAEATEAGSERGENHNGHGLPAARPLHVSVPVDEAPATPSVGAVAAEPRVAPPDDAEALAAMDAAYEALQEARARRQTQEAGV